MLGPELDRIPGRWQGLVLKGEREPGLWRHPPAAGRQTWGLPRVPATLQPPRCSPPAPPTPPPRDLQRPDPWDPGQLPVTSSGSRCSEASWTGPLVSWEALVAALPATHQEPRSAPGASSPPAWTPSGPGTSGPPVTSGLPAPAASILETTLSCCFPSYHPLASNPHAP